MLELLHIPQNCIINHRRPQQLVERVFVADKEPLRTFVKQLQWVATIKPSNANVTPVRTETTRYDELEIILLEITDTQELYHICAPIYKAFRYPCLVVVKMGEKYLLSACPFSAGREDYDQNILKTLVFSHWLFPDMITQGSQILLSTINELLMSEGDIESIYNAMKRAIELFPLRGITKTHVALLTKDMMGANSPSVYASCTPYKKYAQTGKGTHAKYSARGNTYAYRYDTEDLWHAFMSNDRTRRIIEGRRYRDIEDLIFSIDSKYEANYQ